MEMEKFLNSEKARKRIKWLAWLGIGFFVCGFLYHHYEKKVAQTQAEKTVSTPPPQPTPTPVPPDVLLRIGEMKIITLSKNPISVQIGEPGDVCAWLGNRELFLLDGSEEVTKATFWFPNGDRYDFTPRSLRDKGLSYSHMPDHMRFNVTGQGGRLVLRAISGSCRWDRIAW